MAKESKRQTCALCQQEIEGAGIQGLFDGLEGGGQVDMNPLGIVKAIFDPFNMLSGQVDLVGRLVNGHVQQKRGFSGAGAQGGCDRRIDAAGNAYHKTRETRLIKIVVEPVDNMVDDRLGLMHGSLHYSGGFCEGVTPDPISNSEVKQLSADGSVGSPHVRVGHRQALNTKPSPKRRGLFI